MPHGPTGNPKPMYNFLACGWSRNPPIATTELAHLSRGLIHLAEIAYRAGGVLHFDPAAEGFVNDPDADKLLTKEAAGDLDEIQGLDPGTPVARRL